MTFSKSLLIAGLAALALGMGTAAASAATAFASGTVNVRSGAGTGYAVVDVLRRGERVDVQYCKGSWCFVRKSGPDGWVSASYLTQKWYGDDDDDYVLFNRPHRIYRPYPYAPFPFFRHQVCVGGQHASFCVTN